MEYVYLSWAVYDYFNERWEHYIGRFNSKQDAMDYIFGPCKANVNLKGFVTKLLWDNFKHNKYDGVNNVYI